MYKDQIPFETEWSKAHPTVLRLLKQQNVNKLEWQDLFCIVYNIHSWVHEGAAQVRQALSADIAQYVSDTHQKISCKTEEFDLLNIYIEEWNRFYTQTNILPLPFKVIENTDDMHPLNRSERSSTSRNRPVKEVMLSCWNQTIFTSISQKLLSAAEKLIEQERNGESFNALLVIGVRESFVALNEDTCDSDDKLGVYRNTFEKSYIDSTSNYYKKRASEYLLNYGVINYMLYADKKLDEEENRARKYLDPNPESIGKLVESCVQILVIEFEEQILAVCPGLIERNDVEKLQMLYRLVKRTPTGIEIILKCIDEHIRHEGLNDMKSNAETITVDPEKYVTQLLCMFEKFSALVKDGFCDDARLLTARDKAFREIINDTTIFKMELPVTNNKKGRNVAVESKCPELLANYCDLLLRKTQLSKKLSSEEIDEKLNHLLMVLKYVTNKDVFMRFHKAHLSRRLILDMSADQEKEEAVVNRLREAGMPAEHVNKLSRMLQDIELNKDINNAFKKHLLTNNNTKAGIQKSTP
ncbi:unnamed protein product [Auanema sp. JU1783]|nr:unnamed protein product [Auanema sp. JU1783]